MDTKVLSTSRQEEAGTPSATPVSAEQDGYLDSLLDSDGNGLNLRAVCEAVQSERDLLCKEIFGNNYDTTKTQVAFIVFTEGRHRNLYRASYTATYRPEDGTEPVTWMMGGDHWVCLNGENPIPDNDLLTYIQDCVYELPTEGLG